ncbi:hypothetical protein PPERSA_05406 [Pseudocohnilembus persalinus]|uniref:Uncharacterized protein n=1 Tax=Pseudocohnilembus persalinus TaxID=266149 RepID=A0A0V0R8F1_PSEPJ|nr:hypothetical protein PPERSA_05406 [Pseudocohnilembus persalinus]|eukprot:KRX10586.1 hypothetical protein PPERSA_05406 [Pseudocohnilembus persalinus]
MLKNKKYTFLIDNLKKNKAQKINRLINKQIHNRQNSQNFYLFYFYKYLNILQNDIHTFIYIIINKILFNNFNLIYKYFICIYQLIDYKNFLSSSKYVYYLATCQYINLLNN